MRLQPFPAKLDFPRPFLQKQFPSSKFKVSATFNSGTKNGSGENPKPFHKGCLIAEDY
jgi:hypothetical protein